MVSSLSRRRAALVATALIHGLVVSNIPWPIGFFCWLVILVTALFALWPFTTDASQRVQIGTAAIIFALGLEIVILLPAVARTATVASVEIPVTGDVL